MEIIANTGMQIRGNSEMIKKLMKSSLSLYLEKIEEKL